MSTLPFLKRKDSSQTGVITQTRQSDEPQEQDDSSAGLESCGQAIMQAIKSNDPKGLAMAIQDLMEIGSSDAAPEKHSYDHQNQSAGEE